MAAKKPTKEKPQVETPTRSLALRVVARLGELARRSDVFVEGAKEFGGAPGKWKAHVPADMLEFYSELSGGLSHRWRFTDEQEFHGPLLLSLAGDGKSLVNPLTQHTEVKLVTAAKFPGGLKTPAGKPWPANDTIVFFAGTLDTAGMFVCATKDGHAFYAWNADGETRALGTSFTALIEAGLESGFAAGWSHGHFEAPGVVARLGKPVALRETFEVVVEATKPITAAEHRAGLGARLHPMDFAAVMKALGAPGTEGDAEQRGQRFAAALASPELVPTALVSKVATALRLKTKTKPALAELLRWHERGMCEVTFELKVLPGEGQLPIASETNTVMHMLFELPQFGLTPPCDPDVIRFAYPPKFGVYTSTFVALETLTEWNWDKPTGTRMRVFVEGDAPVKVGTFRSTSLPSVQVFSR